MNQNRYPIDFTEFHKHVIEQVGPYTMTSAQRVFSLVESVRYLLANNIAGDFLECGVYKGGSAMAIAMTLLNAGIDDRDIYLFDTFQGMPKPGDRDVDYRGVPAALSFNEMRLSDESSTWVNAPVEEVKRAMSLTGYPEERLHYIQGMVEDTLPEQAPEKLALLRLDTDWYGSTKHELVHLYPRVEPKGVLIVDDYGWFKGAREAVDEYFREQSLCPLLHRIDCTARLILK